MEIKILKAFQTSTHPYFIRIVLGLDDKEKVVSFWIFKKGLPIEYYINEDCTITNKQEVERNMVVYCDGFKRGTLYWDGRFDLLQILLDITQLEGKITYIDQSFMKINENLLTIL